MRSVGEFEAPLQISTGFAILAALLHDTLVVGVSQTLRRLTEGAIYIRQGGHHVGHWPTFLVVLVFVVVLVVVLLVVVVVVVVVAVIPIYHGRV